jgi:hypothetical protein
MARGHLPCDLVVEGGRSAVAVVELLGRLLIAWLALLAVLVV